ncbi:two-component sensor histidine kinase [Lewinella antarctica]|uniref:histidine kinase n=1 Tax=Neolewinella antarctica TaxID=442734 RepID=A0ABX0XFY7_9BACT|nr:two-component sensor histidine kinase [Neolewinella antarctica]
MLPAQTEAPRGVTYDSLQGEATLTIKSGDPARRERTHKLLSEWHQTNTDSFLHYQDSIVHHEEAYLLTLVGRRGANDLLSRGCETAEIYWNIGREAEAEEMLLRAISRGETDGALAGAAFCRGLLLYLYDGIQDSVRHRALALRNAAYVNTTEDSIPPDLLFSNVNELLYEGLYQESVDAANAAITRFATFPPADRDLLRSIYSLRGDALVKLGQHDAAIRSYERARELIRAIKGPKAGRQYAGGLADAHYQQRDYRLALPHYADYFAYAREEYQISYDLDYLYAGYVASLRGLRRYRAADSLQEIRLANLKNYHGQQVELLTKATAEKFETTRRTNTIATQSIRLGQQEQTQKLTYGILVLAVLGLCGLYFGRRINVRKNGLLAAQNDRNQLLLQEIHHRVKNNLETVSSLLELQSASLTDEHAVAAMRASQSRVYSLGLLHQKLYQGKNLAAIEMKDYFTNLAESLRENYVPDEDISITVAMEPLELDVDTAVPLGLIVNELLTNALKYAFVGAGAGAVEVGLSKVGDKEYRLTVRDDGVGKDFTAGPQGTGFGSRLVGLLARQLDGELREVNDGGLLTELTFGER